MSGPCPPSDEPRAPDSVAVALGLSEPGDPGAFALGRIRCPDSPPSWFLLWVFQFVKFSPKARSRGCSNPSHRPPLFHRTFDILISPSFHLSAICPILPGIIHNFIKRLLLIYDINLFRSLKPPVKVRLIISSLIFCKQFHSVSGI